MLLAPVHAPVRGEVVFPAAPALVAGLLAFGSASSSMGQMVRYSVTDLGTLPGSTVCPCFFAVALSNQGHVVGRFFGADGRYHGFLWREGVMIDIGSLKGGAPTQVLDINDNGVATGHSMVTAESEHGFLYQDGVMSDLRTLGGRYSHGNAINNAGMVAGDAQTSGRDGNQRATLWVNGEPTDLGTFGGEFSIAAASTTSGTSWAGPGTPSAARAASSGRPRTACATWATSACPASSASTSTMPTWSPVRPVFPIRPMRPEAGWCTRASGSTAS
jgi:probable HAF family extracellular repeat protein